MRIHGACHCGNIVFDLDWPADIPVTPRACGCTFCQKHGATWTAHADASLRVRVADGRSMTRHRFGTETADFLICTKCGVATVCTSEITGHVYAVVNTRAFEGHGLLADPVAVDFDGEEESARLGRRTRNWIGSVSIELG
ncbi:MAG: hypothetical protein WBW32_14190 [Luteibacter sp.]